MIMRLIEARAAEAARRATFGAVGIVLVLVGLGFLLVALWILLVNLTDAQTASLVIGAVLTGTGLIFLAVALSKPRHRIVKAGVAQQQPLNRSAAANADGLPAVAQAFLVGLQAGINADQRKRR